MIPRILLLALSLTSLLPAAPLGAAAGKAAKKEAAAEASKPKAPAKPIEPAATVPLVSPINAIWHVWKDNQGRTVEAMFCGLSGEFITLQTRDGKTFHFNGNVLCTEDIAFAKSCVTKMRESSFTGGSVAKAAADIDRIVESVLAAKNQSRMHRPPMSNSSAGFISTPPVACRPPLKRPLSWTTVPRTSVPS